MCWYCGNPVTENEPIGRSMRCPHCGKDMRVCRHCRFFIDEGAGGCRESHGEVPAEKDRANFCDWFSLDKKFRLQSGGASAARDKSSAAKDADAAKAAFAALFKD